MDQLSNTIASLLSGASGPASFGNALLAICMAYLGGILSSLTPCVYPMIPITVGVIGGATRNSWKDILAKALSYMGGMCLIYSFLGVLAGLTGRVFGTYTNSAGWYIGIGTVMALASLIMLDVIPFEPAVWLDHLKRKWRKPTHASHHSHGHSHTPAQTTNWGAFFLGATSGLIAAPCTTPVLTAVLAFIAHEQSVLLGFFLMTAFSMGLATILLFVALFTGAIKILPRSGNWMKKIKLISGIILLAFSQYLFFLAGRHE